VSQAAIHHPCSYGFPGQVGFPATVTGGSAATFSFKGLKPSVGHTITWAGGAPATNAVTADVGGLASQAHTYPAGPGTYIMYVTENASGRRWAQRTVILPYSGTAGFAPMSAPPGEDGDGEVQETESEHSEAPVGFDPSAHTVQEVEEYVTNNPDRADEVLIAEEEGKNRVTLVSWLENFTTGE
jgi:hypothetical protein